MRRTFLATAVLVPLLVWGAGFRIDRAPHVGRLGGRAFSGASTSGGAAYVDAGSVDLNGYTAPLALQCTGDTIRIEAPYAAVSCGRASSAYCTKSDGTLVLLGNDVCRRERIGLLTESAGVNDVTAPRDCSGVSWVKVNTTCAKTATGADGVANSASTVTATATDGTILTTVTTASALRSTSMRVKRRTGTGVVSVTRNAGVSYAAITSSLSTTTWKWVRGLCGGNDMDGDFQSIDNCIEVPGLTASVLNPAIGFKLGTSGDAIDIDFVQDEASPYPTSPMAGFARAVEYPTIPDAGLPLTVGEISLDVSFGFAPGAAGLASIAGAADTIGSPRVCGVEMYMAEATGVLTAGTRSTSALTRTTVVNGYPVRTANARNWRMQWASGTKRVWIDGALAATATSQEMPDCHTAPNWAGRYGGGSVSADLGQLNGWLTRMKWSASATGLGSARYTILVGDSIMESANALVTSRPQVLLSAASGGRAAQHYTTNAGTSGYTIDQCKTVWDAAVASAGTAGNAGITTMVHLCGTNSAADGAASVFAKTQAMLESARAAGITVVPSTLTPFVTNKAFNEAYNALLRTWCTDNSVTCADPYPLMENTPGDGILKGIYSFGDGVHLQQAGVDVLVGEWYRSNPAAF